MSNDFVHEQAEQTVEADADLSTLSLIELLELFRSMDVMEFEQDEYLTIAGKVFELVRLLAFSPHAELLTDGVQALPDAFELGLISSPFTDSLLLRGAWEKAQDGTREQQKQVMTVLLENPACPVVVLADFARLVKGKEAGQYEALLNHPNADASVWGVIASRVDLDKTWRDMAVSNLADNLGGRFYRQ